MMTRQSKRSDSHDAARRNDRKHNQRPSRELGGCGPRHDLPAILAHHERDVVMFDLPPPLQCRGIEAYEQTWDLLFRYHKPGTAFDFRELAVTAGTDVAFAVAIMWCGPDSSGSPKDKEGFLFRLTVGLRKVDGEWRIAHEHHSVPATD
jgi:ketosteroid isomerase-like protein